MGCLSCALDHNTQDHWVLMYNGDNNTSFSVTKMNKKIDYVREGRGKDVGYIVRARNGGTLCVGFRSNMLL